MKKFLVFGAVCALAAAVGGGVAGGAAGSPENGKLQRQLAEVRQATAKYHDIAVAEADGYINPGAEHCVEVPGLGTMGVHVVNPALIDGVLEPTQPELLLYVPLPNGKLKLVGVEYLVPTAAWNSDDAPNLFGVDFDGPMPEHEPNTTGEHYDQHAWIWSDNPDGVLATWNTRLSCP
jgi:hypothetical protein